MGNFSGRLKTKSTDLNEESIETDIEMSENWMPSFESEANTIVELCEISSSSPRSISPDENLEILSEVFLPYSGNRNNETAMNIHLQEAAADNIYNERREFRESSSILGNKHWTVVKDYGHGFIARRECLGCMWCSSYCPKFLHCLDCIGFRYCLDCSRSGHCSGGIRCGSNVDCTRNLYYLECRGCGFRMEYNDYVSTTGGSEPAYSPYDYWVKVKCMSCEYGTECTGCPFCATCPKALYGRVGCRETFECVQCKGIMPFRFCFQNQACLKFQEPLQYICV